MTEVIHLDSGIRVRVLTPGIRVRLRAVGLDGANVATAAAAQASASATAAAASETAAEAAAADATNVLANSVQVDESQAFSDPQKAQGRTNLGLGTISTQDASSVAVTGGSITGITDLALADGGTGASTAADARTNLGLGTAAIATVGTSGDALGKLNTSNTWSAMQVVAAGGTSAKLRLQQSSGTASALAQDMAGLGITANAMNNTSKYTPPIRFGSTDANFTTTNPKFLAYIYGYASEAYTADDDSGMGIGFATTPNGAGVTPTPTERMTIDQDGNVTINEDLTVTGVITGSLAGGTFLTPCRAATTANVDLSSDVSNGDTLDGVTLATNDRILVKNQSTASQNGIYVVQVGAATRATDADDGTDLIGKSVLITEGTANAGTAWQNTNTSITFGSTNITFVQISVGGTTYTAGTGLTLVGSQFNSDIGEANNVAITGGSVTGITDITVADGGTGASTAADARTNLGLVIGTNIPNFAYRIPEDYSASTGAGDNSTAFTNWLNALGTNGGIGIIRDGTYSFTSAVTITTGNAVKPFHIICSPGAILKWTSAAASTGIRINAGAACMPIIWQGGWLVTEKDCEGTALHIDYASQISGADVDTATYGTSPANDWRAFVIGATFAGATGVTTDSWLNGVIIDNARRSVVRDCMFLGRRDGSESWQSEDAGRAISFISRDGLARTITAVTVSATPTISYTGTDPGVGAFYYVSGTGMKSIDDKIWKVASVDTVANTWVPDGANTTTESAPATTGTFEGSPQTNTHHAENNKGSWWHTFIYDGNCEGVYTRNQNVTGASIGLHKHNQSVVISQNDYFDVNDTAFLVENANGSVTLTNPGSRLRAKPAFIPGTTTFAIKIKDCSRVNITGLDYADVSTVDLVPIQLNDVDGGWIGGCNFEDADDECINILGDTDNVSILPAYMRTTGSGKLPVRLVADSSTGRNNCIVGPLPKRNLQTTNATTTTFTSFTLKDDTTYLLKAHIVAQRNSGTARASYEISATVYRTGGGSATLQGSPTVTATESVASWNATIDVSGNDARIRVTGAAGITINWGGGFTGIHAH